MILGGAIASIWLSIWLFIGIWLFASTGFDRSIDYFYAFVLIFPGSILVIVLISLFSLITNKKPDESEPVQISLYKQSAVDKSEKINYKIRFVSYGAFFYNLYFTDKRLIVFYLGKITAFKVSSMKKILDRKDSDADLLTVDTNMLINFHPLNFSISYDTISEVFVKKNRFLFKLFSGGGNKKRSFVFFLARFTRKDKRSVDEFMPIFMKYFSSKIVHNKSGFFLIFSFVCKFLILIFLHVIFKYY
jgi:hypothetical protein